MIWGFMIWPFIAYCIVFGYVVFKLTDQDLRVLEQRHHRVGCMAIYLTAMIYISNYLYWDFGRHWWFNLLCALPMAFYCSYRFTTLLHLYLDQLMDWLGL